MASIFADRGEVEFLVALVDQADALLKGPGREAPAVEFYNELARMAERDALAAIRDDLRDRSLMGLALKLRQRVTTDRRPGQLTSSFLGRNKAWSPDLVDDANHALKAAFEFEGERLRDSRMILGTTFRGESRRIGVDGGIVSAACHASSTGEVFLGFEGGRVYSFDAVSGVVRCLSEEHLPIASMAVDSEGQTLVLLLGDGPGPRRLVHLDRTLSASNGWARQSRMVDGPGDFWLTPLMSCGMLRTLGVWNGEEMLLMGGIGDLAHWIRVPMPFLKTDPPAAILVPWVDGKYPSPRAVLVHDGPDLCQVDSMGKMYRRRYLGWRPTLPEGHTLRSAPLAWIQVDPERFELAGLDREGVIHWSSLKVNDAELIRASNNLSTGETVYAAASLVRAGLVAGVTPGRPGVGSLRVDWLRCGLQTFALSGSTELVAAGPLACFPSNRTDELIVVCQDGTLACVQIPR